ncbi:MAG: hypothetical protein RL489_3314 [Pseudomonadota bacterium]|jgi:hypothetical protein
MPLPEPSRFPEMLDHRPEARAFKVEDIMLEIQRGRLRIPSFQRRLSWDRGDARKLVDSLYRGYPVGTLLLWETSAHEEQMQWGSLRLKADTRPDALLVVDGQQRLVSLARILLTTDEDEDDFALYFDLDDKVFVAPTLLGRHADDPARWLPLNRLLNSERLFEWLYDQKPSRERREQALLLGKRLREYDIPAYIVRHGSESVLREIFGRMNSMGKKLEAAEVFDALNGTRSGERTSSLTDMVRVLDRTLAFGQIDEEILYRLLRVLHGLDVVPSGHAEPLRLSGNIASELYAQTEQTTRQVVQFMRRHAGIPHYSLLPYKQPMVTLGKFFYHHPTPRPRSCELLARWLWRGALNGLHRGDTVSTRAALDRIDSQDEEHAVQRMIEMVGRHQPILPSTTDPFNFRFAASKLQAIALLELQPRHLETGELLDLNPFLDDPPTRRDPPFAHLVKGHGASDVLGRSVANRLAYPVQAGLRKTLLQVRDPLVLASHGISAEAFMALQANNSQHFLELRAATLQQHFEQVFARHARWDASDRPSVAALVVPDDDEDEP